VSECDPCRFLQGFRDFHRPERTEVLTASPVSPCFVLFRRSHIPQAMRFATSFPDWHDRFIFAILQILV
jgi:hypothetical protein